MARSRSVKPTSSQQFAQMSRAAIEPRGKRAAKQSRRKGGARDTPPPAGATNLKDATALAVTLGRAQAAWSLEQRAKKLAQRAKVPLTPPRAARARRTSTADAVATKAAATRRALALRAGPSRGVLVAEGDSWFDYPFHDVLKELDDEFRWDVEQVAHRGDTVESMAYDGGQLDDFVRAIERVVRNGRSPHAILLSGGGNDVVGDWFGMLLDHRSSPTRGLNPGVVDAVVETRIGVAYTTILTAVTAACQGMLGAAVPILLHGYDYPVPDGRGFLGGWGPLPGPWMEPGFREKGYDDLGERVAIARNLIDRLYRMLDKVAAAPGFSHVRVVDLRGTLSTELAGNKYKAWWDNELHPSGDGFTEVARLFDNKL